MSKVKEKWTWQRVVKEVLTTLVLFFIISQVVNFIRKPDIQTSIYAYELNDIKNEEIDFFEYKDEPLIVHFWATWCPTCKLEASNIQTLSNNHNVISIAVNSGTNEELSQYMSEHDFDYRVINDANSALAQKFNIGAYPTTLIYNAKGELKFTEVGYSTTLGLQARLELIK
ncbi:MAG: Membrane protein, suppressor for copper-sensitivity ScsD [uncultured Sulfurovum sp.]|uniref:Membrane protein, suppressor for copper-sensitivity ScsD n=1 Tax=uncultured Sulfurovum sp. TaxID=269237 RepID=A0A6S6S6D9_9BACT|nr:MAG: Membrane protein, suppressor for copper-sensitivity ScsD [uncultured Sulfurovum sp.]